MAHRIFSLWEKIDRKIGNPKIKVGIFVAVLFAIQLFLARKALATPIVDIGAYMATGGPLGQMVIIIITMLLIGILYMAMIFDMMLTYLVIMVASYNNFVNAAAVVTGWPLVRDVVNMFFIVVLLVIAFGTIIGYKEFDYKKYVPRLLLMAVLINFSKTLVGLLIDFSQVIMLTFVNGFKDAAFGNFVKAFGLDKVLALATTSASINAGASGAAAGIAQETSLMTAAIFGLGMLTITGTVLLIMLIYLIARVIGLWAILIFAPLAFFIWALPPKLQKSVSQYGNEWWSKLGALLAGGPIMAFFLWLTMAIVSSNEAPFGDFLSKGGGELDYLKAAISQAASMDNVARFVVATAFLLMGVQAAVSISKSVGGGLGNIASKISSKGGPIGMPLRAGARAAGRTAGAGAKFGGKLAVSRFAPGIGEKFLQGGQQLATRGGFIGSLAGQAMGGVGTRFLGAAGKVKAEEAKKIEEKTKGLGARQRGMVLAIEKSKALDYPAREAATKKELSHLQKKDTVKAYYDDFLSTNRAAIEADVASSTSLTRGSPEFESEVKARSKAAAEQSHLDLMRQNIKNARAQFSGDTELMEEMEKWEEADPRLLIKDGKIGDIRAAMRKAKPGDVSPKTLQSLDAAIALLEAQGVIQNGAVVDNPQNTEFMKYAKKRGGDYYAQVQNALGQAQSDPSVLGSFNAGNSTGKSYVRTADGFIEVASRGAGGGYGVQNMNAATRSRQQLEASVAASSGGRLTGAPLANFAAGVSAPLDTNQTDLLDSAISAGVYTNPAVANIDQPTRRVMGGLQGSGVASSSAFNYDAATGAYAGPAYATAHREAISEAISGVTAADQTQARENIQVISTIDPGVFSQQGDATVNVATSLKGNLGQVEKAIASGAATTEQIKGMENLVQSAYKAGEAAINREAQGIALSAAETAVKDLRDEIEKNNALRGMARRKNK